MTPSDGRHQQDGKYNHLSLGQCLQQSLRSSISEANSPFHAFLVLFLLVGGDVNLEQQWK